MKVKFNLNSKVFANYDGYGLYVDEKDYQKAIEIGSKLAFDQDLYGIDWINANNEAQPVGYIPVMYAILPSTIKGDVSWCDFMNLEIGIPKEIMNYLYELETFIAVNNIKIKYNNIENSFTILAVAPFGVHDVIVKRCKGFNKIYESNPFENIYYLNSDNTLKIDKEEVLKEK